ncbi:MAG TPA: acetate kinase [Clostridiaceae bacterium]|nr:acetate kinase [Clostridiaceae bacterium]
MKILVINAGSSSLKYQLMESDSGEVFAKGLCERIGIDGSRLKHEKSGQDSVVIEVPMPTHSEAIEAVIEALTDADHGVISSLDEIDAVGHRVVHGGEKFAASAIIDDDVKAAIRDCFPLAPLHNPPNMTGIEACEKAMPGVPMVAVFDTAFHQTMPDYAYMYALPYELYEKHAIRRYGFHGTSHKFVSDQVAEFIGKPKNELKIITLHLGNGSSISAVDKGRCVDTTMGLTPLAGVPMGTRCGDIDPAIVKFLADSENLSVAEIDNIMNKQSGMLGVSGVSSDFRDLGAAKDEGNDRAALALNMFMYQCRKVVGSYVAAMGGVDAIVFTAGVGENDKSVREGICDGLECMGIVIDTDKNRNLKRGTPTNIAAADSKVDILVIPTDEELVIASDTAELVKNK